MPPVIRGGRRRTGNGFADREGLGMFKTRCMPLCLRLPGSVILALGFAVCGGCSIVPPILSDAYTALSGVTYLLTSKSPAEQALSIAANKDCSFFRILEGRPICVPKTPKSNQWLFATLADMVEKQPRDLPPGELLRRLPPVVNPGSSPGTQPLLVMSREVLEHQPRELRLPELLDQLPPAASSQLSSNQAVAGLR